MMIPGNKIRAAAFLGLLFLSASFVEPVKNFSVEIEQSGKIIPVRDGVCRLKKEPFTIVFRFSEPMGLLVNASFSDSSYLALKNGLPLDLIRGFTETGMAEGTGNDNYEVSVSDEAPNYWYYDNEKEHRFNETIRKANGIRAKREIRQVRIIDGDKTIAAKDIASPLYLTFASYDWIVDTYERRELQREWIKLEWEE